MPAKYWAMFKREVLEHRSALLWTPALLCVAFNLVFLVFGFSMESGVNLHQWSDHEATADHQYPPTIGEFILFMGVVFAIFSSSICFFYTLDSLYADRRDHSILFWRSLPVSEWQNITVKIFMSCAAIPLFFFIVGCITGTLGSLFLHFLLGFEGSGSIGFAAGIWHFIKCIAMILVISASLLPIHSGLLLISALARRSPFFTLMVPLVGLAFFEKIFLGHLVTLPAIRHAVLFCLQNARELLEGNWSYNLADLLMILTISVIFIATTGWVRKRFFEI